MRVRKKQKGEKKEAEDGFLNDMMLLIIPYIFMRGERGWCGRGRKGGGYASVMLRIVLVIWGPFRICALGPPFPGNIERHKSRFNGRWL